jgi:hypothetical protein
VRDRHQTHSTCRSPGSTSIVRATSERAGGSHRFGNGSGRGQCLAVAGCSLFRHNTRVGLCDSCASTDNPRGKGRSIGAGLYANDMKTVDPYYEWLGIPPKDQPPNHYRLLGLELFEENRSVIDTAANRQMSFIKQYQTGADSELTQKLLNELSAARLCLLSASAKAAYDEQLRAQLGTQEASAPAMPVPPVFRWRNEPTLPDENAPLDPLANAIPLPVATALDSRPASAASPMAPVVTERPSGVVPRSTVGLGTLAVATGLVATALAVVLAFVVTSPRGSESTSPVATVAQRPGEPPANTETEANKFRSNPFVVEKGAASEPPTFSPLPELAPEGAQTGEPVDSEWPPPPTAVSQYAHSDANRSASESGHRRPTGSRPVPVPVQQPGVAARDRVLSGTPEDNGTAAALRRDFGASRSATAGGRPAGFVLGRASSGRPGVVVAGRQGHPRFADRTGQASRRACLGGSPEIGIG